MKVQREDALKAHLLDACNFRALQMFAQEHAKVWRDEGVFALVFGKINAAIGGICVENEFNGAFSGVYNHGNFFAPRLADAVDAPARERGVKFFGVEPKGKCVLRHTFLPRLWFGVRRLNYT